MKRRRSALVSILVAPAAAYIRSHRRVGNGLPVASSAPSERRVLRKTSLALVGVALTVVVASPGSAAPARASADVWVNLDGFKSPCTAQASIYPAKLYSQARSGLAGIGYSLDHSVIGRGFTRTAFLQAVAFPYAVYVHSHGDVYASTKIQAAFLQDPQTCPVDYRVDYVSWQQIKPVAVPPYELVIMSTCYLGSYYQPHKGTLNMMPDAFAIAKNQMATNGTFYLGYRYSTWDSEAYRFEGRFFNTLLANRGGSATYSWAWAYAMSYADYAEVSSGDPFEAAWFGDVMAMPPSSYPS